MKKKNAFTLIELLAIIVILAIIAVITVPIILNIIENSKRGAATDSAYGYKDAVNKAYVTKLSADSDYVIPNNTYTVEELKTQIGLSLSGKEPASNSWVTIEKNNVTSGCLQYDEYKAEFTDGKVTNTEKGVCSSSIQYGYKSVGDTEVTIGTSGYTVTGENTYLKYALTNGEVAEGTVPEACIYSEAYSQKELCLKNNEYETSAENIKTYYGYTTEWIHDTNDTYKWYSDSNQTITCYLYPTRVYCTDSTVHADAYGNGYVSARDDSLNYDCYVRVDGGGDCNH